MLSHSLSILTKPRGFGVGATNPNHYTLNLDFTNEFYEIYEYGTFDASLNLNFVEQIYQSE